MEKQEFNFDPNQPMPEREPGDGEALAMLKIIAFDRGGKYRQHMSVYGNPEMLADAILDFFNDHPEVKKLVKIKTIINQLF